MARSGSGLRALSLGRTRSEHGGAACDRISGLGTSGPRRPLRAVRAWCIRGAARLGPALGRARGRRSLCSPLLDPVCLAPWALTVAVRHRTARAAHSARSGRVRWRAHGGGGVGGSRSSRLCTAAVAAFRRSRGCRLEKPWLPSWSILLRLHFLGGRAWLRCSPSCAAAPCGARINARRARHRRPIYVRPRRCTQGAVQKRFSFPTRCPGRLQTGES